MAVLQPLCCIRPAPELAAKIASGPHSNMSPAEIREKIEKNPFSYSRIVHPRAMAGEGVSRDEAYRAAGAAIGAWIREGRMIDDRKPCFYLYRLESAGHSQTGIVGCTEVDEILKQNIRAHEKIRENKLKDLTRHMEFCGAQVGGPILMAYRRRDEISLWMEQAVKRPPLAHFLSENQVWNTIWRIDDAEEIRQVRAWMEEVPALYIADGHHRMTAAISFCMKMRRENPGWTGDEPWNRFACVCFPDDQLQILPYSRVVRGRIPAAREICRRLSADFEVSVVKNGSPEPGKRGEIAMYTGGVWRRLRLLPGRRPETIPENLDTAVLQSMVLKPVFGVDNPGTDARLEFIGGHGQRVLAEEHCRNGGAAFLLYPTSMEELFAVADCGATMPPKSTWFEPKLCNGLFVYRICGP